MFTENRLIYRNVDEVWQPHFDYDGYPEANGSCGLAGLVSLEGKASVDLTRDSLQAVANMPFRTGVTYNDHGEVIAADGAGGLLVYDKGQMAQMLTERQRKRLNGDLHRLQVGMFEFRRDDPEIVVQETKRAIERCFEREGLTPLSWREVPTNENGMCEDRLPQLPKYQQLFFMAEGVNRVVDSRALYIAGRRINADIRNVIRRSLSLDRIAYSGLITPEELAGCNGTEAYFTDLLELMAVAIITHGRFATNVLAANPQPTDTLGHNGEINTIAANRKSLLDLGRALGFFNKLLTNGGSDSIHLNDALCLMLANGVPLAEAMLRLMPPALKKVPHAEMKDFIRASKRAMGTLGMWEGPAAVLATDGKDFGVRMDRLGLRMLQWLKYKKDGAGKVMGFSSESGAFEPDFADIEEVGRFEAGGGMNIDLETGEVVGGNALFDKVLRGTGLNWRQLSHGKLIVPKGVPDPADKAAETPIYINDVLGDMDLKMRLAAFGWKHRHVDSAVTRLSNAKPIISSLGSHTPVGVLDPKLANSGDLYKASAAIVTNPPFDAQGEPDVVEPDVRLGSMPQISARKPGYTPVHPQFELPSPLLSTRMLGDMRKPAKNKAKVKTVDIGFGGQNYESFSARIAQIIEEVVHEASLDQSHRSSVIVLSDKNVFDNGTERLAIPPVFLVQRIHTALINKGLRRNVSLVVESGGIRHAHDSGVLIANGCDAVCLYLLEAIAMKGKDPEQAMKNFFAGESAAFGKVLMKLGITTAIGATGGYWVSGIGLAPEVVNQGGAKINSKVGGMDMRLVFDALIKPQAERYASADEWIVNTREKDEKAEGAYQDEPRELFNLIAFPDIGVLKKKISIEECPRLYDQELKFSDEELSDIAFAAACKRREEKNLTLRDNLKVKYKYGDEKITEDMMKNAPSLEQIFKHIFQAHMSLGAQGPAAHAAMVRGCKRVGVQSANGEGGEERERSRDGSRSLDRSESRQMGTAGWGVDLQYLMEADELCVKIAQGAKPGEGGDLPEKKVNQFVAALRHVKVGTRLISPPPNHDIYSIEDLKGRIRALRALNPRARISIKLASMPGLGSISEGIAKAGADVIEVSGFDAGTGASDELSIEYTGWMVENGVTEAHQYLVSSGVRDRIQLRGDGKMMTPQDFVKMLLMGSDGIGLGTLLMIFCKCIACKSCHTDKCPTGITTQDWERIVKFFVKGERPEGFAEQNFATILEYLINKGAGGVERGLKAFGRAIQREIVKLGFNKDNWEGMIGNVDMLEQKESGRPAVDSMDLETPLLRKVKPPKWKNPKAVRYGIKGAVRSIYKNSLGDKVIDQAESFLDGQMKTLTLEYNINNRDREFAVGLVGEIYERMIRKKILTPNHRMTLKSRGWGGHNYGFAASDGMTLEHTGFMNDSCGQAMSGTAKIVIKCPEELKVQDKVLLGNQACMWATGGTLHCGGIAGARLGVRNSGATIVTEGALDYPFEYMTAGLGILLGDYIGEVGSRMTGGKLFLYRPDNNKELKYAKDYVAPKYMSTKDLDLLKRQLESFYKDTGSEVVGNILENWTTEKCNFISVVPKADLDKGDDDE